jgi:predicted nucleotidyltransferase
VTKLLPGVRREDLPAAEDPNEGMRVALAATQKLKQAYGERLVDVLLFGSWVRGEAHEESDVDLLVVLDQLDARAAERNRIVEILFDLEADSRRAIQAFPVDREALVADGSTFAGSALREGVSVLQGGS